MTVPLQPKGRGSVLEATGSSMPAVGSGARAMAQVLGNNPITKQLQSWTAEMVAERKINKQRERISQATRAGAAYGNRFDEDNKLMPLESLSYTFEGEEYSEGSPEQSAFQEAALQKYGKNLRAQYGLFAKEAAVKHQFDPAGLIEKLRKHKDNIWINSPDFVKNELEPELRHITNAVFGGVLEASLQRDRDNTKASLEKDLLDTQTEIENLIRIGADQPVLDVDGNIEEDRLSVLTNRYKRTLKTLEDANLINSIDADNQLENFTDNIDASVYKQRIKKAYKEQGLEAAVALTSKPYESRLVSDEERAKNIDAMFKYATVELARAADKEASLRKARLEAEQKSNELQIQLDQQDGITRSDEEFKELYQQGKIGADFYFKKTDPNGEEKKQLQESTFKLLDRQINNPENSWDETNSGYRNAHLMFIDRVITPDTWGKLRKSYLERYQKLLTQDVILALAATEANFTLTPTQYSNVIDQQVKAGNTDFTDGTKWLNRIKEYRKDWIENEQEKHNASRVRNHRLGALPLTKKQFDLAKNSIPEHEFQKNPADVSVRFTMKTSRLHPYTKNLLLNLASADDPTTDEYFNGLKVMRAYRNADQKGNGLDHILMKELGKDNYKKIDAIMDAQIRMAPVFQSIDAYRGWVGALDKRAQDMSSTSRVQNSKADQPDDVGFGANAYRKLQELRPRWYDGFFAGSVEEYFIGEMGGVEDRTGIDIENMPTFPPDMVADLQTIYAAQSKEKYTNEDSPWRVSFATLFDRNGWTIEMQNGEAVWVSGQPTSQSLPAVLGSGVILTNRDHQRHVANQLTELGYRKKNGRRILTSDIRFVRTKRQQNYTQRGPFGAAANVTHIVSPFEVEYKDGDIFVTAKNFLYTADDQELLNRSVQLALLEVREGESLTEPINYFLQALSKAGIGDMSGVISDKTEKYFDAFRERSHLNLLEDRLNAVLRKFGSEEINFELDYEDYTDSVVPGDVAARMVWDSWRMMSQTAGALGSDFIDFVSETGKPPKATAKFDVASMARANKDVLDIKVPDNATIIEPESTTAGNVIPVPGGGTDLDPTDPTNPNAFTEQSDPFLDNAVGDFGPARVLPDGTRVTGDASVFALKEPDPLDIKAPADAVTVLPDGTRVKRVPPGTPMDKFNAARKILPTPVLHTPGSKGKPVVKEVTAIINNTFSRVTGDSDGGGQFLTEIANAESNAGEARNTFALKRDDKGIWQVSSVAFKETQENHARLRKAKEKIKDDFGIDWNTLDHEDVTRPLVGALAARLYLMFIMRGKKIPKTLKGRAQMWKNLYNTAKGKGTVEHYLKANA